MTGPTPRSWPSGGACRREGRAILAETESFVSRWSRLKREAALPAAHERAEVEAGEPPVLPDAAQEEPERPPLPPLESLGGDSDYSLFLAPDVPEELHRLALRKAWTSNPTVASFRGFGEYDWDYNAPGYGQLLPTDDIVQLCRAILGQREPEEAAKPEPAPEEAPALLELPAEPPSVAMAPADEEPPPVPAHAVTQA